MSGLGHSQGCVRTRRHARRCAGCTPGSTRTGVRPRALLGYRLSWNSPASGRISARTLRSHRDSSSGRPSDLTRGGRPPRLQDRGNQHEEADLLDDDGRAGHGPRDRDLRLLGRELLGEDDDGQDARRHGHGDREDDGQHSRARIPRRPRPPDRSQRLATIDESNQRRDGWDRIRFPTDHREVDNNGERASPPRAMEPGPRRAEEEVGPVDRGRPPVQQRQHRSTGRQDSAAHRAKPARRSSSSWAK